MTAVAYATWGELAEVILRVARELDPHGESAPDIIALTGTERLVMRWIDRHPGTSPSTTADATALRRSNVSAAVRELERKGMIERRARSDDGRHVQLFATDLAIENIARLRAWWTARLQEALPGLDDDEVDAALSLLRRLDEGLRPSAEA